jgi:hypothetical protein
MGTVMIKRCLYLVVILAGQGLYTNQDIVRAETNSLLTRKVGSVHIEEFGVYNVVAEISQKAHVPVGVDAIKPEREPTIVLDFLGGTVTDLLNTFVSQVPDYGWEETSGRIIRVFRRNAHVTFLDVPMSYPGAAKKTRREIWEDLGKRPELLLWLKSNHCSRGEFFNGYEFKEHNDAITVEAGRLTLEQLLDEVAVQSGVNYWAVLQSAPTTSCHIDVLLW